MGNDQSESVQALLSSISHDIKERIRSIRGRIFVITKERKIAEHNGLELITALDNRIRQIGEIISNFRNRPQTVDFETIIAFIQNELNVETAEYLRILNQLQAIRKSTNAEKELDAIVVHSKRMSRIIEGINGFARSNGKLTKTYFGIHNEIERIKNDLERSIDESKAVINHNGTVKFYGDQLKIAQLFQNLIQNSIIYARNDISPVVQIEFENIRGILLPRTLKDHLKNFQDGEYYLYSRVSDNGIGIADEYQKKVFNLQFRINRDRQIDENKGGGLGLAIVKSIAEAHDGAVWLDSTINIGTTVHILLLNKNN